MGMEREDRVGEGKKEGRKRREWEGNGREGDDSYSRELEMKGTGLSNCTVNIKQQLIHPIKGLFSRTTWVSRYQKGTRSSAIAEEPRDASCQLKTFNIANCHAKVQKVLVRRGPEPSISCR